MKKLANLMPLFGNILIYLFCIITLFFSIRGIYGNPNSNNLLELKWRDNGPFELSPERGRFGLLYSLAEDKSFYFSTNIARFILPDLGYKDGRYVSLFAPAVSFVTMPGYIIGKLFNLAQIGTFAIISLFALINSFLIKKILRKLGAKEFASTLAGLIFLFATPAFAYAVNLYQHHISTFLILFSVYLLMNWDNFWSLSLIWLMCAMSIPVDYPNLFLMFPIGFFATIRFFSIEKLQSTFKVKIKISYLFSLLSILIPIGFFMWFNKMSYGNPLQFSGTVASVKEIDLDGKPTAPKKIDFQDVEKFVNPDEQKKSAVNFFKSRNILQGMNIHLISPDRGIIVFTPILLLAIFGGILLYKNKYLSVFLGIIGANLFLYSMWGDPWGGWAFGSRYMIPSYSILAILLGVALSKLNKKWYFIIPFWILLIYSIGVNTLGALTTSANPPQTEADALSKISGKKELYSYDRNWEFLNNNGSKSFVYKTWGYKYVTPVQYYYIIAGSIAFVATLLTIGLILEKNNYEENQT